MFSYWEQEAYFKDIDYLIIGAGIVGLSTAIYIKTKQPSSKILILEKGVLPNGASTKNAGFACIGSPSEILSDLQTHSEDNVINILKKRWNGLQNLRSIVKDIDMDFQNYGGYEVYKPKDDLIYNKVINQLPYLNNLIETSTQIKNWYQLIPNNMGLHIKSQLVYSPYEGQINPVKMMDQLMKQIINKGIKVLNGITVAKINKDNNSITTKSNLVINANKILVCTNAFAKSLVPEIQVTPARNQVLMTKPIKNLKIKGTFHYNEGYIYFRNYGNRILLGGARHLALEEETTTDFGQTEYIKNKLISFLSQTILPNQPFEIDKWWSGIIGIGEDKNPIIKKINKNLLVAVRLSGIGIAIGSIVGEELAKLAMDSE